MTDSTSKTVRLTPEDRASHLDTMLVMEPIPDTTEVKQSLVALLREDGFNKLAAQLRYDANHELEHVFTTRTYNHPITLTETSHDGPLISHPLGALLPLDPPKSTFFPFKLSTFKPLFQHPSCCDTLSALLALHDHPPLSVHFTQFTDATLIGLTIPHVLADMTTISILLLETIKALRREADAELDSLKGEWVSEHDLVVAWMLQTLHPSGTKSSFSITPALGARKWAGDLFKSTTYLGNAVTFVKITFPPSSLTSLSIARLALAFRKGLLTMTPTEVLRSVNMHRTFRGPGFVFPNPPPTLYFTSAIK
ncbi:hypothetical protein RQP46_009519 [Phenoliferia psychrophenolica]